MQQCKHIPIALALTGAFCVLAAISCTNNPSVAGGATETVNAMLYEPDGAPAANATVRFFNVNSTPTPGLIAQAVESTLTDQHGRYAYDNVPGGTYNILGEKDGNLSFLDSVTINTSTDSIPPDTLKAPGTVTGVVRLRYAPPDSQFSYILVLGTNMYAATDSLGRFTLRNMAGGKYGVRVITTTPDYHALDTTVTVSAGVDEALRDTVWLRYTGIPVPQNVRVSYDTLKQIVTLMWRGADTGLVKGFNVYRRNVDSNTVLGRINGQPVADSVYRDSTGVQEETYEYRLAAVGKTDNEGGNSYPIDVTLTNSFILIDTFGSGILNYSGEFRLDRSQRLIVPDIIGQVVRIFDTGGVYLTSFGSGQLEYPYSAEVDSTGEIYIGAQNGVFKFDSAGRMLDTFFVARSGYHTAYLNVCSAKLFVSWSGEVRVYALRGDSIATWGGIGSGYGQFLQGSNLGICALPGEILVCEQMARRIQVFDTLGVFMGAWTTPFDRYESAQPIRITTDEADHFYVVLQSPNSVLIFSQLREFLGKMTFEQPTPDIGGVQVAGRKIFIAMGKTIRVYQLPIF